MKSLYSFFSSVNSASNVKLSESLAANSSKNLLNKFILRTAGLVALFLFLGGSVAGQCGPFQIYESFGTNALPTLGGTWAATSMSYTGTPRSGVYACLFNATGDIIRTPQISNPGVISFWYRRSGTSATHGFVIETSPDNATWTTRDTYSGTMTTAFVQRSVDLGALGLSNVFIRVRDTRASGTNQWYLDDLSITSTVGTNNTILIQGQSCTPALTAGVTYSVYDRGGVNDEYSASQTTAPMVLTPPAGYSATINFTSLGTESCCDRLLLYNGSNTAAAALHTGTGFAGTTAPGSFTASNATYSLTVDFTSDGSINGSGFAGTLTFALLPSCSTLPSALTSSVTSSTTATLSWTAASPAPGSGYDIYYSTSSTVPVAGTGATTTTGAGVVTKGITGLTVNTTYYWWVRSNCNGTDKSNWVYGGIFSTRDGENCALAQDLALLTSPFSSTTVGYINDFTTTNGSCLTGTGGDRIFKIDIPNGGQLFIGQSTNAYDSRHRIAYGGACPGTTEINTGYVGNLPTQTTTGTIVGCLDDDDLTHYYFNNTTGSTQTVYWIQDGHLTGEGTFTLEWLYLAPCSGPTSPGDVFTWSPALVTGYNADVIANGVGNASSSASQFDVAGYGLVSADFKATTASAAPTYALPVSGVVNSAANTGVRYQLASSNLNNSLRLVTATPSGTLTLTNGTTARRIGLLVSSGSGTSTFTAQVNFSDGTNQVFAGNSVSDWYGSGYAIAGIGRVVLSTSVLEGSATQPGLYDVLLTLDAANYTKTISSIQISKTDAAATALNVMGVSLFSSAPAPSAVVCNGQTRVLSLPDIPSVSGLTYLWQSSPTGAAPWTSTGVTTTTFTTPALTTPGTMYYRCRVQCSGANNAFSSVIGFTVNDNASVSADILCSGGTSTATALPSSNSTYFWSSSLGTNQTATISAAGTYTVNVNNNGCISANNVTVAVAANNTVSLSSASGTDNQTVCLNGALTNITFTTTGATGIGTASGLPVGVTASWSSNILTIQGSPSDFGTYNYSIPLTGGCGSVAATGTISITPLPSCVSSYAPADASTDQNANGLNITWGAVSGATSYDVYFGTDAVAPAFVANQSLLSYATGSLNAATTYYWKVIPRNCSGQAIGCSIYSFTTGASCTAPTFSATATNINCFGGTGSISISATGGVSPYQYSIDNGTNYFSSSSFSGLSAGTYVVTVKGDDGCQGATSNAIITQPASLSVSASGSGSGCEGSTLSLNSSVSGGTSPYTYSWSNAGGLSNGAVANPTATIGAYGSHTLTVTDANGCTATSSAITITNNSPAAPTVVTPAAICQGQSANLNATSAGNSINWYTTSSAGTAIASLVNSGANYSVSPLTTTTYYAEAVVTTPGTQSFSYTGSIVNWTVPAGVTSVTINAKGASGGYKSAATAGKGASMTGAFNVTPGQVFSILVGQSPGLTTLYPGGGGGTYVALGSNYTTATPLIVAGGGGGANSGIGTDAPTTNAGTGTLGGVNGNGATQASCTGGGGGFYTSGANDQLYGFFGGAGFRQGGAGGAATSSYISSYQAGGFGGGSAANYVGSCNTTAGNGGGYGGGGGQGTGSVSIGNAGGSFNGGTSQNNIAGNNVGNGSVTITYSIQGCASARTPVIVTVNQAPTASAGAALSAICQGQTSAAMGGSIGGTATSSTWTGGAGTWTNANDPANATYTAGASESGTITLTLTPNGGSCPSVVATKTIVVNANPNLTVTPSTATICSGSSQALSIGSGLNIPNYNFASSTGTYTAISGGTASTATGDDAAESAISIGFNFYYRGLQYNQFGVSTNGIIQLGSSTTNAWTNALASTADVIAPFWDDNNLSSGSIKYTVTGTTPNRILTVEWLNVAIGGGGATGSSTNNFQVKLFETTNVIQMLYGTGMSSANGTTGSIGISGSVGSYLSVTPGATPTVSSSAENSGISSVTNLSSGTIYTFSPQFSVAWTPTSSLYSDAAASTAYNGASLSGVYAKPTTTTTYSATATSAAGCTSSSSATVTVNQPSVAPTAITGTTTICNGSSTTLTANGTLGTGASYEWGTGSTVGTNPIAGETSASITVSPTSTITYWVRITGTTSPCTGTTSGTTATVNVNQPSVAPTSISGTTTICNGETTTLNAVGATLGTGASYEWGTGSTVGSNPIAGTGASISVSPSTTTTYWVRVTGTTAPCSTTTDGVTTTVTVNALPTAVTVSGGGAICAGSSATLTADNGSSGTIYWQNTTSGGTSIATASASQSISAAGTYYFRPQSAEGCWGTQGSATVTITALPSTPVVTVVDNCNGTSTLSTTATGTLLWSTTETATPITVSSAGTYTVTQTANGCTSAAGSGVAAPKSTPATPVVSVTNNCGSSTLSFTPAANTTILWSNNATTSSTTTTSSETLTVVQTLNGCPSAAGSGSAVPLVIPSAPTATASQNFCVTDNATVGSLAYTSVAGNTYTWYDAATAGNTVATSTQLPTAITTYYLATTGSNGCTSLTRTAVAATESAQALASVTLTGGTSCPGSAVTFTATPTNGGSSPTYQWYNGGVPISGETGNTYIATGLAEGAVITVKMIPSGSCVTVCPN